MGLFLYLEWVEGASDGVGGTDAYRLLIIVGSTMLFVSMCFCLLCVGRLVEFDQDYDSAKAIFPAR